jgi:hypothetical protein
MTHPVLTPTSPTKAVHRSPWHRMPFRLSLTSSRGMRLRSYSFSVVNRGQSLEYEQQAPQELQAPIGRHVWDLCGAILSTECPSLAERSHWTTELPSEGRATNKCHKLPTPHEPPGSTRMPEYQMLHASTKAIAASQSKVRDVGCGSSSVEVRPHEQARFLVSCPITSRHSVPQSFLGFTAAGASLVRGVNELVDHLQVAELTRARTDRQMRRPHHLPLRRWLPTIPFPCSSCARRPLPIALSAWRTTTPETVPAAIDAFAGARQLELRDK